MEAPSPKDSLVHLDEDCRAPKDSADVAEAPVSAATASNRGLSSQRRSEGGASFEAFDFQTTALENSPRRQSSSPQRAVSVPLEMQLDTETAPASPSSVGTLPARSASRLNSQAKEMRILGVLESDSLTKALDGSARREGSSSRLSLFLEERRDAAQTPDGAEGQSCDLLRSDTSLQRPFKESRLDFASQDRRTSAGEALLAEVQDGAISGLMEGFSECSASALPSAHSPLTLHSDRSRPSSQTSPHGVVLRKTQRRKGNSEYRRSSKNFEAEVSAWPGRLKTRDAPVEHVVFVIHGIGCGSRNEVHQQDQLRNAIRSVNALWFWREPVAVHVLAINWKQCIVEAQEELFQSIGISSMYEMRRMLSLTAADILFFMTPRFGDFIMQQVSIQLNAAYRKLKAGGFEVMVDLLDSDMNEGAKTLSEEECAQTQTFMAPEDVPSLEFPVECLFLLGGCLPAFLLLNSPQILNTGLELPPGLRVFNIFHPCDPVAFRLERLVYPHLKRAPPPVLLAYWRSNGLQEWFKWNLNVQMARQAVMSNLNFFASSVLSWWKKEEANEREGLDQSALTGEEETSECEDSPISTHRRLFRGASSSRSSRHADFHCRNGESPRRNSPSAWDQSGEMSFKTRPSMRREQPSGSRLNSARKTLTPQLKSPSAEAETNNHQEVQKESEPGTEEGRGFARNFASWLKTRIVGSSTSQGRDGTSVASSADSPVRQLRRLTVQDRISRQRSVWSPPSTRLADPLHSQGRRGQDEQIDAQVRQDLSCSLAESVGISKTGSRSSTDFFLEEVERASGALEAETLRAIQQLEEVNSLKEDEWIPVRFDFQLQEDTAEHYLSSLAVINSHFNYFKLRDVAFFILKCLSNRNPALSYTGHLKLLEAAALKAAERAEKAGLSEEQQRHMDEAAALAEKLSAFEDSIMRESKKKTNHG